jgi:signal transduction histidine kinase
MAFLLTRRLVGFSRAASAFTIIVGGLVLCGWLLDIALLKRVAPGLASMKVNTALCFVLSGACLWLRQNTHAVGAALEGSGIAQRIAMALAWFVVAVATITLSEDLFNWNARIDDLLIRDLHGTLSGAPPGRMSPATAFNFMLIGASMILLGAPQRGAPAVAQGLAIGAALIAAVALLGYLFNAPGLYRVRAFSSVALHTALTFFVLSIGILVTRAECGWVSEMVRDTPGARMGRSLLICAVTLLPALGWLRLKGQQAGWYGVEFGLGMMIITSIVIFGILIWITTRSANIADAKILHLNRLYATLSHINQLIVRDRDRDTLFREACRIAVEQGCFRMAWIGLVEDDAKSLTVVAHYVHGEVRADATTAFHPKSLLSTSLVCRALVDHTPVVVNDLAHERQAPWSSEAERRDFRSMAAFSLRIRDQVIGAFAFYSKEVAFFDKDELALLTEITDDVGFALRQIEAEAERTAAEITLLELKNELENRVVARTAELELANKELEAFSYSVSHDLRSPLRAINGYAQILQEDFGGLLDEPGIRLLKQIDAGGRKMARLIDDLLEFSKLGRKPLKSIDMDMTSIVHEAWAEICEAMPDKAPDFRSPALPHAYGDPVLLKQVWSNLLSNALKYSSKRNHAVVEVSAEDNGAEVIYCVKDNGVGFDMQHCDKLFHVFQRLHAERDFSGTGVGLAIVQRVVTRHGGRVWAEGEIDKGAAFFFALPKQRSGLLSKP